MTTQLTWTKDDDLGDFGGFRCNGRNYVIERDHRGRFVLYLPPKPGEVYGPEWPSSETKALCKGSLKVCKGFAQDLVNQEVGNELADVCPGESITVGGSTGPEAPEVMPCAESRTVAPKKAKAKKGSKPKDERPESDKFHDGEPAAVDLPLPSGEVERARAEIKAEQETAEPNQDQDIPVTGETLRWVPFPLPGGQTEYRDSTQEFRIVPRDKDQFVLTREEDKRRLFTGSLGACKAYAQDETDREAREELKEKFRKGNGDPANPLKVVWPGDPVLDPELNSNHPVPGSARVRKTADLNPSPQEGKTMTKKTRKPPQVKADDEPMESQKKPKDQPRAKGARYKLFGFPVTAVLRWMGKEGWKWQEARRALDRLGVGCADATVKIQILAGAKGERGEPASLSREQQKELKEAAKE